MYIFHIDMNFAAFKTDFIKDLLRTASEIGFDTVLWELEDKVALDTLGKAVHPCAMSKHTFRDLLSWAESLGLVSVPLFQTLGHGEYILEKEAFYSLREGNTPDCYCVSSPAVRDFQTAVIDEIADLFNTPVLFHLGGDEAYHFATCSRCAAHDRKHLFCEHENYLAAHLASKGIRPAIWHDMPYENPELLKMLDPRFVIFLWNYDHFNEWPEEQIFAGAGFDTVVCPSSCSCGDSPFLPVWKHHSENITGAAALCHRISALGMCMTSWSIRLGLKMNQRPLWELGAKVFLEKQSPETAESEIVRKYFSFSDPEAAGAWHGDLLALSGVQWDLYKDGAMPPAGYLARILSDPPGKSRQILSVTNRILEQLSAVETGRSDIWYEAIQLKKRYLVLVQNILTGGHVSGRELRKLEKEFCTFLEKEQLAESAGHNARLVFTPLIEYLNCQ